MAAAQEDENNCSASNLIPSFETKGMFDPASTNQFFLAHDFNGPNFPDLDDRVLQHVHCKFYLPVIWRQVLVEYWEYRTTPVATYEQKNVCCTRHKLTSSRCIVTPTAIPKSGILELGGLRHALCTSLHQFVIPGCCSCDTSSNHGRRRTSRRPRSGPSLRSGPQGLPYLG
jgi:hypothetical protein